MRFDEKQYERFLAGHGRNGTHPEDPLERYAITSPLPADAEISAHVQAVRRYWNKLSNGNSRAAREAKWAKARDDELKAEHGDRMLTREWWRLRLDDRDAAAQRAIADVSDDLRQNYGPLGVVTEAVLRRFATSGHVTAEQARRAAEQAGLTVVGADVTIPEAEPIAQFSQLVQEMATCGKPTVPELLHPGSGPFSIVPRYACVSDKSKRLDAVAVEKQLAELQNRGISRVNDSWIRALRILRTAQQAHGARLESLTLYHLAWVVHGEPTLTRKRKVLTELGLVAEDAAVIAVLLGEQSAAAAVSGLDRVRELLGSGHLREAQAAAEILPAGSDAAREALELVTAARDRLGQLITTARHAVADADEALAERTLKDAALISAAEAAAELAMVPPSPPAGLRATGDGTEVKLFWNPGAGHDAGTAYVVHRTAQRPPAAPGDGERVYHGSGTTCADPGAPAARPACYGVFAVAGGRPPSRPATANVMLLPPVTQLIHEAGPATVELRWAAPHPAAEIRVTRSAGGAPPVLVPVRGNRCVVTGLPEGQRQTFEVVAVYRDAQGTELRSAPEQLTVAPRAETRPVTDLRAEVAEADGALRVRVTWKAADGSDVVIMRTGRRMAYPVGSVLAEAELPSVGIPVSGRVIGSGDEAGIETELPPGVHCLAAFSRGSNSVVAGPATKVAVTDPVRNLHAAPFAGHAVVAWEWPPGAELAEVSWGADGEEDDLRFVSLGQYRAEGGVRVPLGAGPCTITVRSVVMAEGVRFSGPPVAAVVGGPTAAAVRYTISGLPSVGPFGGRSKKVTFIAAHGCADVQVRVVARHGQVMPTRAGDGVPVLQATLSLAPGVPAEYQVSVPKSVRKPFWVRCFVIEGQADLLHPPVTALREG